MRTRKLCILLIAIIMVCLNVSFASYFYKNNRTLVSMNKNISVGAPIACEGQFIINKDREVWIKLGAQIKEGNIKIYLLDEDDDVIREFDSDTMLYEMLSLEKGSYCIRAESQLFRGSYRIKVYDK